MSDVGAQIKDIFEQIPGRLNPSAAAGMNATILYDLTGDGGGQYACTINNGACTVTPGATPAPAMTVTMTAQDFIDMLGGRLDGMSAFMSGKLRIAGDMGLAMKLQSLFRS